MCEEHYREAEVQEQSDELTLSLDLLEAFVYEVRGHPCGVLEENLERPQVGFQERLADTNGLLRMLSEQADRHKGSWPPNTGPGPVIEPRPENDATRR